MGWQVPVRIDASCDARDGLTAAVLTDAEVPAARNILSGEAGICRAFG